MVAAASRMNAKAVYQSDQYMKKVRSQQGKTAGWSVIEPIVSPLTTYGAGVMDHEFVRSKGYKSFTRGTLSFMLGNQWRTL